MTNATGNGRTRGPRRGKLVRLLVVLGVAVVVVVVAGFWTLIILGAGELKPDGGDAPATVGKIGETFESDGVRYRITAVEPVTEIPCSTSPVGELPVYRLDITITATTSAARLDDPVNEFVIARAPNGYAMPGPRVCDATGHDVSTKMALTRKDWPVSFYFEFTADAGAPITAQISTYPPVFINLT
ncbi:hypothetical protein [Rhodococcus sp. WY5]|uniref:hypothetical protein n=1 Tax=Rhodococcus sp. WY5 TaxID=2708349 RepID=UPI001BDDFCF4|nr:hypothetical protein [Rhodococcus sp. WY5]